MDITKDTENQKLLLQERLRNIEFYKEIGGIEEIGSQTAQYFDKEYESMRMQGIDIIVPVYQGVRETRACIESILASTTFPYRLLLINDCSPEPEMADLLESYADGKQIRVLHQQENMGFSAAINRGIQETEGNIVILNSDTEVAPHWLDRLVRAASWNVNAATVTPYSTSAGIFTLFDNSETEKYSFLKLARLVRLLFDGSYEKVPVGHGFCMLIRRKAIAAVGLFDEEAFEKGYGEENDFCLRCSKAGFIHILDPSCLVRHVHRVSFGQEAENLIAEHRKIIDERYPEYSHLLAEWKRNHHWKKKIQALRNRVFRCLDLEKTDVTNKKCLLIAMHRGSGGSVLNRMDLAEGVKETCDTYMLTGNWKQLVLEYICEGERIAIRQYSIPDKFDFLQLQNGDVQKVYAEILRKYGIHYVNMSHLLGQTMDLPMECQRLRIPCIYVLHDYYLACPNFTLLDENEKCCEGNCLENTKCVLSSTWFPGIRESATIYVNGWRKYLREYLAFFDKICAPSVYTAELFSRIYPEYRSKVLNIEHGRNFNEEWYGEVRYPQSDEKIRVVILGNIGISKGLTAIRKFMAIDEEKKIELHILGEVSQNLKGKNVYYYGKYERSEVFRIIKNIKPHYGLIPSIFPETYCHTLTELWSCGLPVIGFDVGVIGSRLRESGAGWLVPCGDVQALYELITNSVTEQEYYGKIDRVKSLRFPTVKTMAQNYLSLFQEIESCKQQENEKEKILLTERVLRCCQMFYGKNCSQWRGGIADNGDNSKLLRQLEEVEKERKRLRMELDASMNCTRRKVGNLFVDAALHPRLLWKLPVRLAKLAYRKGMFGVPPKHFKRSDGGTKTILALPSKENTAKEDCLSQEICYEANHTPKALGSSSVWSVSVVVCVHNAFEDTVGCLKSVWEHRSFPYRVIIVDDASDMKTAQWLKNFAQQTGSVLLRHEEKKGYTVSANEGIRYQHSDFVVLLNSDTIVASNWIETMIAGFENRPSAGIFSPLSNAATYQSVPLIRENGKWAVNVMPEHLNIETMNMAVRHAGSPLYPELSCVNGFCFMIRREVIDQIGLLDEEHFPLGYGEEVDYCIRCLDAGFTCNVLDSLYIWHTKSQSFTPMMRDSLSDKGKRVLEQKYGEKYRQIAGNQEMNVSLAEVRSRVAESVKKCQHTLEHMAGKRIACLLPAKGGAGGANSICQEFMALKRMGLQITILNQKKYRFQFMENYPEWIPYTLWYDKTPVAFADEFDLVICSIFHSVEFAAQMKEKNPLLKTAYYVQDYEPMFFHHGDPNYDKAWQSYDLIPDIQMFAKTDWICETVRKEHPDVTISRVQPGLNWRIYNPYLIRELKEEDVIRVIGMVRPQTPRRQPGVTLEVLGNIKKALGDAVEIHLFGCSDEDLKQFEGLTDFSFINHAVLKPWEVAALLAESHLFVDMSYYQAFGRTGLEAMCYGCTAVLPQTGGAVEFIHHGKNAILEDTTDVKAVTDAVLNLLADRQALLEIRKKGIETAKNYSTEEAAWSELLVLSKLYVN